MLTPMGENNLLNWMDKQVPGPLGIATDMSPIWCEYPASTTMSRESNSCLAIGLLIFRPEGLGAYYYDVNASSPVISAY